MYLYLQNHYCMLEKGGGSRIDPFCNLCHFDCQNLLFAAYLKRKMLEDV